MAEIKTGDVVILKSDVNYSIQTIMTVGEHWGDGLFFCYWFVNGEIRKEKFHKDTLIAYQ